MSAPDTQHPAQTALYTARASLEALEARCCDPGRSPRMAELAATLSAVEAQLPDALADAAAADEALACLEDAGAQIGSLQIGCCAPNRLPLYAEMLSELTTMQLEINKSLGRGH